MASLIGFLMLMLWFGSSHSLFPDLWVQKIKVTVPPENGSFPARKSKTISGKQLVKDRAASSFSVCLDFWYTAVRLKSRWRSRACSSWVWHQKSSISWVVPLELWHHCPRGKTSSHAPCNCLRRMRNGTFFFLCGLIPVLQCGKERTLGL